jgi:hypothetical protein
MFCPTCGKQMPDDAKFCDGCGSAIGDQRRPAPQQPIYAAVPPPPPPQAYGQPPGFQTPQPAYYQSPAYVAPDLNSPMSVGAYIGTLILSGLPVVGFILLLVWAFSTGTNINKKNLARAILIMYLIMSAIYIIFAVVLGSVFIPLIREMIDSGSFY